MEFDSNFFKENIGKKTVDVDKPYMTFKGNGFEWRVLKRYQFPNTKRKIIMHGGIVQ